MPIMANVDKGRLDFRCHTAGPSVGGGGNLSDIASQISISCRVVSRGAKPWEVRGWAKLWAPA